MSDLPKVIDDNPDQIVTDMIAQLEGLTGKTVLPAQIERLLVNVYAYRESLVRAGINHAFRQGLVRFAEKPLLDYLGELLGVRRLDPLPAMSTVRVSFTDPLISALVVPSGTRFETASGIQFQTTEEHVLPQGAEEADLPVEAVVAGSQASGLLQGQINVLVDDLSVEVETVSNLTISAGGTDEEDDDHLRERIQLAPEAFSTAGSRQAYRYHVLSTSQDIVDVAILTHEESVVGGEVVSNGIEPGEVHLYPLLKTGLPGLELRQQVETNCSDERVRPLNDVVEVLSPSEYGYTIQAGLRFYRGANVTLALASANEAAIAFAAARRASLGSDVIRDEIIAKLRVAGVYDIDLGAPAATIVVPEQGWANCTLIDLSVIGVVDG